MPKKKYINIYNILIYLFYIYKFFFLRIVYLLTPRLYIDNVPLVGTLTVEQIYQDRDQFARLVREVAAPDVGRMGIEILSFTIKVC